MTVQSDDIYIYDKCLESYAGRGLPACQDCPIPRRTVCMKIRSARNNLEEKHVKGS